MPIFLSVCKKGRYLLVTIDCSTRLLGKEGYIWSFKEWKNDSKNELPGIRYVRCGRGYQVITAFWTPFSCTFGIIFC